MKQLYAVLPGRVDDPAAPSGGNHYDRRLCQELTALGWSVREIAAAGAWPHPAPAERRALASALASVEDGALVLVDGLVGCAAPAVLATASRRLRLVLLVHLPLADETGLDREVAAELDERERQALRSAPAVIATSGWAAQRLVSRHGLAPERVQVAIPGTDPAPLAPGTDGVSQLLCVAAVTPRKGQDVLVEALAGLADQRWHCLCVGAPGAAVDYPGQVRRLVRAHGLTGRVQLAGPRTGAALAATYAAADLLVLPSHAETYGMVITEALARGVPVLATSVGGVPEALGRTPAGDRPGRLVPAADPAALAAALREWLADPSLRDRWRRAARARRAELASWRATAESVAGVLDALGAARVAR